MEGVEPEVPSAHATNDDLRNDAPTLTLSPTGHSSCAHTSFAVVRHDGQVSLQVMC
jgi:hypothetical protein